LSFGKKAASDAAKRMVTANAAMIDALRFMFFPFPFVLSGFCVVSQTLFDITVLFV